MSSDTMILASKDVPAGALPKKKYYSKGLTSKYGNAISSQTRSCTASCDTEGVVKVVQDACEEGFTIDLNTHHPTKDGGREKERKSTTELFTSNELYDREYEQERLLEVFDRRLSYVTLKNELVLVSGKSGTGKTTLARKTLSEEVTIRGGYFIMGKFDQMRIPQPYSAFVHAFTDFIHLLVDKEENFLQSMKQSVMEAVDPEALLLLEMIPALEQILDVYDKDATPIIKGVESQSQLRGVFCKFVRAICSPKVPLVLCIDDLQWADAASLDLFQSLASMDDCQGLVLVATCRGNEISVTDTVAKMLCSLEDHGTTISHIELFDLSKFAVYEMVKAMLGLNKKQSKALTRKIYEKTSGNGFFVIQLLNSLKEKGVIYQDCQKRWHWDDSTVPIMDKCGNAMDLLIKKLKSQSEDFRTVMATASCFGSEFDEYLLHDLLEDIDVPQTLAVGVEQGLLVKDEGKSCIKFVHDQIQQAAYLLIPVDELDSIHLDIGRKLMKILFQEDNLETHIFLLLDQFSRGIELITDREEKDKVAEICLKAAQQASTTSDFRTSSSYLDLGISLMSHRSWRDEYYLMLGLHNTAGEVAYCLGDWRKMERMTDMVIANARSLNDKIVAYSTKIYSYGSQGKLQDGINTSFLVLKSLGEPIPAKSGSYTIFMEYAKTRHLLLGMSDERIMRLQPMTDSAKMNAMSILNVVSPIAYRYNTSYNLIVTFKMVQLTLKHGLCPASSWAFASLGLVLCALDKVDEASRFGELALKLVKMSNRKEWFPRVNLAVHGTIFHFKKSSQVCLEPLKKSIKVGLETGDIEFAMTSAQFYSTYVWNRIVLTVADAEFSHYLDMMRSYKQDNWVNYILLQLQVIDNFMGKSNDPLLLMGHRFNQKKILKLCHTNHNHGLEISVYWWRLILAYVFKDYGLAFEMIGKCQHFKKVGTFRGCLLFFYEGLVALAMARETTKRRKRRKYIAIAKKSIKNLGNFSRRNPSNFMDKLLLLEAEFAVFEGKLDDSVSKYDSAIMTAESEKFLLERAMSCERAGLAMEHFGKESLVAPYFVKAKNYYHEWGAHAKVSQISKHFGDT